MCEDRLPVFVRHAAFSGLPALPDLRDEAAVELAEKGRAQLLLLAPHGVEFVFLPQDAPLLGEFPQFGAVPHAQSQPCAEQHERRACQNRLVDDAFAVLFLDLQGGVLGFELLVTPEFADVEHFGAVHFLVDRVLEPYVLLQGFETSCRVAFPLPCVRGVERP